MRATVQLSAVIGSLVLLVVALACGGGAPAPGGAPGGGLGAGLRSPSSHAYTQWKAHTGQTYTFDGDGVTVTAGKVTSKLSGGHLELVGSWRWKQHDACTATLVGTEENRRLNRVFPKCTPSERGLHADWLHTVWMSDGQPVGFGEDGSFWWRSRGTVHTGTYSGSSTASISVNGKTVEMKRLDNCYAHVMWDGTPYTAKRTFPPCRADETSYGNFEWSVWKSRTLTFRFQGGNEMIKHKADKGTWSRSGDTLTANFETGQLYVGELLGDCAMSVQTDEHRFRMTRAWPPCP